MIETTHVGSLPRGDVLTPLLLARDKGEPYDAAEFDRIVQAAVDEAVAAPVITAALYARFRSRSDNTFGEKLLSAMRKEFGGHIESTIPVHKAKDEDK
jgi:6-phosphogluconate dehydrogenase (decarboxylating)